MYPLYPFTLTNQERPMTTVTDLQWKKFPVLDDGFVCLVDVMGTDASVVQAARVSYGNDKRDMDDDLKEVEYERDRGLIRYMMRNHHGTPFEMATVKLLVRVPMDCWRQWIRHRTQSVNEYSTRYTEAIDSQQKVVGQWRAQSVSNKQGSEGTISSDADKTDDPARAWGMDCHTYLSEKEAELHQLSRQVYEERLRMGVAREQARKDLPLSTYTEAYVCNDLRNWLHFLGLRMDSHAQQEIREYANTIGKQIIKPLFPLCWEAFLDYQLGGMTLSRLDIEVIQTRREYSDAEFIVELDNMFSNKRERDECLAKLQRLELI